MQIKIGSNFSFSRLFSYTQSASFGEFLSKKTVNPIIKASKEKIISGKVKPPLKKSTRKRRRYSNSKAVNTPLYDTGALYNSLQLSDVRGKGFAIKGLKGMMMEKYGLYHLQGFTNRGGGSVPARNFISFKTSQKTENEIIRKLRQNLIRKFSK